MCNSRGISKSEFIKHFLLSILFITFYYNASYAGNSEIISYEFITDQSSVLQTGGIAGVHETYSVEGTLQLSIDFNTKTASFEQVDAVMLEPTGFLPTESLGELFNMARLQGIVINDSLIVFIGKASQESNTDIVFIVTLSNDTISVYGRTFPPACCDFFTFELDAVAKKIKYSGGIGEANSPYQIATAEDLITLGKTPEDYGKHFILTNDIDLNPNLPGRKVFHHAVIAPLFDINDPSEEEGSRIVPFTGVFDGNNNQISNLTIEGLDYVGLFGITQSGAIIKDLGVVGINITGSGNHIGGLVGSNGNEGTGDNCAIITGCYTSGVVTGTGWTIGGLVGINHEGLIIHSYSTASVSGNGTAMGGLIGYNNTAGSLIQCYSITNVNNTGGMDCAGLVGYNSGAINCCFSIGTVNGSSYVGGLAGHNTGSIVMSYSTCMVTGDDNLGGLVGYGSYNKDSVCIAGFWDMETSGQNTSAGGTGLTTAQMQDPDIFLNAGWDCIDEYTNGTCDYWQLTPDNYPSLNYTANNGPAMPEGSGTTDQPYLIRDICDLGTIWYEPTSHYLLDASLDLSNFHWSLAVIPWFNGTFDGNGYTISNLKIKGGGFLGLFGHLGTGTMISNLGMEMVDVNGTGDNNGALAGFNTSYNNITANYSTGKVAGDWKVGGLIGSSWGNVSNCYSSVSVNGSGSQIGGLIGCNSGYVINCYSNGIHGSDSYVGGLIGETYWPERIFASFWDIETSGTTTGSGGTGLTTAEMQTESTFTDAGWDFIGETDNGNEDIWWIDEGIDYPRLWWE